MKSWTVKATDKNGKVQHEQEFKDLSPAIQPHHDAEASAKAHRDRIANLFPDCKVTITPSE